ncbi:serine/threonine-protein kinase [Pantoea trifolii]|uniref:serine/threonine-protein kinase n=1 Tax=Pantoea trifolii TaxID=2968030 RepID=UPI003EDB5C6B
MEPRGNYLINPISELGRGAFGRVEKVEVFNTQGYFSGFYARKVLDVNPRLISELISLKDWKMRFEREVKYQAKCSHSHIVPVCIHHLNVEHPWFVMELAEKDLRKEIISDTLSDIEKLNVLRTVLLGVSYIHGKSLLHRDLKPENILKYPDGSYKISDFGLVKNTDPEAQSAFLSNVLADLEIGMGTPDYMAPEAKKGNYTEKTDIYALGVIINEMNLSHINGIDEMVGKSAAYKPAARYNSVQMMIDALDPIIARSVE